jgi:hypothetical protein
MVDWINMTTMIVIDFVHKKRTWWVSSGSEGVAEKRARCDGT